MKDRTPHPIISLREYRDTDLEVLFSLPRNYTWTQIHVTGCFQGLEKCIGYTRLRVSTLDSQEPENVVFMITEMTQYDTTNLKNIQIGETVEIYCMVESTLASGKTLVMIEKLFNGEN
jgi:hypothetical protein